MNSTEPIIKQGLRIKDTYLKEVLEGKALLKSDGAMGTMLQDYGLATKGELPDLYNFTNPDVIVSIHKAYVDAGSQIVATNTFRSNALKLEAAAKQFPSNNAFEITVESIYKAAAENVRKAGARYIAGDVGPIGEMIEPYGDLEIEEAYELYAQQMKAIEAAGCDVILIETETSLEEIKLAIRAAKDATSLPVFASMTFNENGRTFMGDSIEDAAETFNELEVQMAGMNCTLGPKEMLPLVEKMGKLLKCPLIAQPNAGMPQLVNGATVYQITAKVFAEQMKAIVKAGAKMIGGCCGTTPEFISALNLIELN